MMSAVVEGSVIGGHGREELPLLGGGRREGCFHDDAFVASDAGGYGSVDHVGGEFSVVLLSFSPEEVPDELDPLVAAAASRTSYGGLLMSAAANVSV